MENCAICSKELKFINTPTFGAGKLSDGNQLCSSCYSRVNKINPQMAFKLKSYDLPDVESLFEIQERDITQRNAKLDKIKAHIQNLNLDNISTFFGRKEINELPNILAATEIIDNIIQGTYNGGMGILVSTNRRLIFIDKGLLYGLKVEDFPLDKITTIQYETGILFGKVKIHTSANRASIDNVDKNAARKFAEFVRDKLSQPKENTPVIQQPDIIEQIKKLNELKEVGILTQEEFETKKQDLLNKL